MRAEPVTGSPLVLGQARCSQLPQPVSEHTGRHARYSRRQITVGQPTVAQFPQHTQRPSPSDHLEQLKQRSIVRSPP